MIGRVLRAAVRQAASAIAQSLRASHTATCAPGRYAVTVVSPPGYMPAAAFAEIAQTIHYGLRELGHDSVITTDGQLAGRRHIVLGSNLLPHYALPLGRDAILYNLEQVDAASSWITPPLLELFQKHTVWDYNAQNAAALSALGVAVARVVPIGYVRELSRIQHVAEPDIDVLFFGSINARRQQVLNAMLAAGLKVQAVAGVYGAQRDALIARAKVVLNVHYYEAKVLELVRLSYLLSNRCVVLSEHGADPREDEQLADGVAFADYQGLVRRARELIEAPAERARLAQRGFEIMASRPAADYLRAALAW